MQTSSKDRVINYQTLISILWCLECTNCTSEMSTNLGGRIMDISKYITNKDIQLSNEDLNLEKLEKDIRKGYVLSEEVESARNEALKEATSKYAELEEKYNSLDKSYNDLQAKHVEQTNTIGGLKLQVEMVNQGFGKDKFDEISKLRSTLYAEEKDDGKAISMIKEKFGATYFPQNNKTVDVPQETNFNTPPKQQAEIKITRKTGLRDLLRKN